ncbi:4Fe-4S dicluster protein [Shimia isoporae]|uniref:4Fe-4S dicluster protein n=2 Tax=Shimia isoporae TaxID=647720 RepID=A0A4R1N4G6_9RHOB|nr:4Fe-4S dicluster protein [Shimia isoporae]
MARVPEQSGNALNGLDETEPRRARMVYWAPNPDDIPHGGMQRYFLERSAREPAFGAARAKRQKVLDAPLPDIAQEAVERTSKDWTVALQQFVAQGICEQAGVAEMQSDWVVEGFEVSQRRVIILGVQHDYGEISTAPDVTAGLEVMQQYERAAAASKAVAGWLRMQGWDATPVTGPMTGALLMIPPALACGFGELGKHGSIINPEMGASFRLSAVLTDAPFDVTEPVEAGIDGFCQNCRVCEDACPPEALFSTKKTVRGVEKWYVDFDRCLPFFNQTHGCAICIAVCPWSRPGIGPNLAAKLSRRAERLREE